MRFSALIHLITAVIPAAPNPSKNFAKVKPTGEYQDAVFKFSAMGRKYSITARGQVSSITINSQKRSSKLEVDEGFIEKLSFMEYEGNLLLLIELDDHISGWGNIYSLNPKNSALNWKANIPGFNIGESLIEQKYAYITAIGFIAKINLNNGRYIWQNDNLYKRSDSFNNFVQPQIEGQRVIFRGDGYLAETPKSIVVDKISGKILAIK
jgi:hypothetical protein